MYFTYLVGWQSSLLSFLRIQKYVWELMYTIGEKHILPITSLNKYFHDLAKEHKVPPIMIECMNCNSLVMKAILIFPLMQRNVTSKLVYVWRTRWAMHFVQM